MIRKIRKRGVGNGILRQDDEVQFSRGIDGARGKAGHASCS